MLPPRFHARPTHRTYYEQQLPQPTELEALPTELQGSNVVCELDGHHNYPAQQSSAHDRRSHSLPEPHDYLHQPLPDPPSQEVENFRARSPVSVESSDQIHTLPYSPQQFTANSSTPNIFPISTRAISSTTLVSTAANPSPVHVTAIQSSSSTLISPTVSPVSSTHWDKHDHMYGRSMSEQNDMRNCRGSLFSDDIGYLSQHVTSSNEYTPHDVEPFNNFNNMPTPPTGSPSNSDCVISPFESQCHVASYQDRTQCPNPSQPIGFSAQGPSIVTSDTFTIYENPEHEGYDATSQQRMHIPHEYILFPAPEDHSHNLEEVLSIYSPATTRYSSGHGPTASQIGHSFTKISKKPKSKTEKRGNLTDCVPVLRPLPCGLCDKEFNGSYQKGNLQRHLKQVHPLPSAMDGSDKNCRECDRVYKRADARRKHEWKKHRIVDAKPEKRRKEKKDQMANMVASKVVRSSDKVEGLAELY